MNSSIRGCAEPRIVRLRSNSLNYLYLKHFHRHLSSNLAGDLFFFFLDNQAKPAYIYAGFEHFHVMRSMKDEMEEIRWLYSLKDRVMEFMYSYSGDLYDESRHRFKTPDYPFWRSPQFFETGWIPQAAPFQQGSYDLVSRGTGR